MVRQRGSGSGVNRGTGALGIKSGGPRSLGELAVWKDGVDTHFPRLQHAAASLRPVFSQASFC